MKGALALTCLFLVSVPFVAARWTLPTQLQISRVFWLIDFVTLMYGVALVAELSRRPQSRISLRMATAAVLAVSVARGAFVMLSERSRAPDLPGHAAAVGLDRGHELARHTAR